MNSRPALATWGALIVVYIIWGSTYLGIRVLDRSVPPLLGMGARFLIAGVLLAVVLMIRYGPQALAVEPRRVLSAGLAGTALLGGGNGAVALAERSVPSGLAALLVAAVPLWLVCLRLIGRDTPRPATIAGTVLGFAGIAALSLPGSHAGGAAWGTVTILAGTVSWSIGSFASPRLPLPSHPFVATCYEMLAAGMVLTVAGVASGESGRLRLGAVPAQGWAALAYLIVFGSLAGFSAYVWLLGHAPLSLTATYAYVNPVVAVLLGASLLHERVTGAILLGGVVVVAGVAVVVSAERPRPGRRRQGGAGGTAVPDGPAAAGPALPPAPGRDHDIGGAASPLKS